MMVILRLRLFFKDVIILSLPVGNHLPNLKAHPQGFPRRRKLIRDLSFFAVFLALAKV
jgi:hypothetical protein